MVSKSYNFTLFGYRPMEQLCCDSKIAVYRAQPTDLNVADAAQTVIIKVLCSEYPTYQELLNFRHQYTIAKSLDIPGIVRTYSLEEYQRGYALVMEDFGGISLTEYRQNQPLAYSDVLDIAIQLADTLHALGQQRIVHKDIKPANILINPSTKQVKLIDFSIASLLPRETQSILSPSRLEGTLAYISPEQTGRMNRGIDYRTDFYALGVTLYELLVGKLPFETEDFNELIYCHLAQQAILVDRVNPDLPPVLSQIVAKLMAKNAEDRYQSALGLKYDLELCLTQYQLTGKIDLFNLGSRDLTDRFLIPEHLYGRESEVQILLDGFTRVSQGQTELMLVAGFSGIGKTAVVNEIHRPITRQHGYFIKGKYDQFNRNIPLSAFVQAFRDLIDQLLSENDLQLANWKSQILAAVGENGQVLIAAIPELELVIGSQPAITQLSGMAAQNRFNLLFQKFIEIFTTPEHPLVIFLDDLQWADSASIQLMKLLMGGKGYLLLLGAYRDNEVSPIHPLMLMVQQLQQAEVIVKTITLAPLGFRDTNQLIADTLHCSTDRSQPLAKLIDIKTQGNPFFITQFLKALYSDGEIWFNPEGYWECDITRVEALALTDDVVEFMALQLQKLPSRTQEILKLAACIGNQFDLDTLAIVSAQSPLNAASDLWQGLQVGLILPNSQIYKFWLDNADEEIKSELNVNTIYRFLHDRVQQAAYFLIPEDRKPATHLKIGRLLYSQTFNISECDRLLEIVNQFNAGASIIDDPSEQQNLVQMNLFAACRARSNTAYHIAFNYSVQGIKYLSNDPWKNQYQLALSLHEIAAETAQLINNIQFNNYVDIVLKQAINPLDRCGIYRIKMTDLIGVDQFSEAIDLGIVVLAELDIHLSKHINKFSALLELVKTEAILLGKNPSSIKNRRDIDSQKVKESMRFLDTLISISYLLYPNLFVVVASKLVQLSERYGNCEYSGTGYAVYSLILATLLNQIDRGIKYNRAAIDILEKISNNRVKSSVLFISSAIKTWDVSLQVTIDMQHQGYEAGIEVGNFEYAAWNLMNEGLFKYLAGEKLCTVREHIYTSRQIIASLNQDVPLLFNNRLGQSIDILLCDSPNPLGFRSDYFDDRVFADRCHKSGYVTGITHLHIEKLIIYYMLGDLSKSLESIEISLKNIDTVAGHFINCVFNFYSALTMLAVNSDRYKKQIFTCQKQVGLVAKYAPMSASHKWELIEAERLRRSGKNHLAIELYDRAISSAKANGFIQEEALANELAAKFYLAWGKEKIAATYMQEAYYGYARWGATAKTNDLEQRYPQLLTSIFQSQQQEVNPLSTLTTITNYRLRNNHGSQNIDSVDLASVIQSAQVLSSTLDLTQLIGQIVEIILKNSGAETCILALPTSTSSMVNPHDDEWQIEAIATVNSGSIHIDQTPKSLTNNLEYPAQLIYWIKNAQKTAIFDARQKLALDESGRSSIDDQYLSKQQPQSVFALPIVKQKSVIGVLYLEHRNTPDLFTVDKKTIIDFLCSQAAIAIDNANLYHNAQIAAKNISTKQSYLEALLNNIPHIAWLKDESSRFISVNQAFGDMSGYEPAELVGKKDLDIWPVELAQKYFDDDLLTMQSGQRKTVKEKILTSQQEERWLETIKTPFRDNNGNIIGTVGIALDITDRKIAEQKLEFTQFAVDNSADGIALLKLDGSFAYVNKSMCRMLGYSAPELASMYIWDIDDQASPDIWPNHWQQLKATGGFSVETHHQSKNGNRYPVEISLNYFEFDGEEYNFTRTRDVTAAKAAELALSQSQARYQKLADNIPGVIYQFQLTPDGKMAFPYISSGCYELFEIEAVTVIADGSILIDTIHPDDLAEFERIIAESAQNMTPKLWEGRVVLSSGMMKWIKSASRPERQADGSIVWDGVMLDITEQQAALRERQQTEIALLESKQFLQTVLDSFPLFVFWKDRHSVYLGCNQKFAAAGGVQSPIEIAGKTDYDFSWGATEADAYRADDRQTIDTGIPKLGIIETQLQADGSHRWLETNKVPLLNPEGEVIGVLGTYQDVSSRKQAELELAKSQQKYYNLIQSINGVVWEYDLTSDRFSFVSDRAVELFGYPVSDWLSQANFWQSHIYPDDLEQALKIYDTAIGNHQSCEFEYRLIAADGRAIWVYDISTIVCDLDGNPIASNGLFIDISNLKQVETDLQQANERLELTNSQLNQATRLKDEFLATMSHELRTPLNAILGMSEALQEEVFGTLNSRQIKSISTIEKSGEHLLSLINDILDVSKIAAGKLALDITEVSLADLCKSSIVFIKQQAFEKQIQINTHFPANLEKIFVDERRMRQVLINLLNNAVKFTPNGGVITLTISMKSPAVCHHTVGYSLCFDISDTGIGIAKDDLAKLFQPFIQVDSNLNRKYQGTGLGLVLVKQIVELHGGSVSISSEVGKGSCCSVMLPQTDLKSMSKSLDPQSRELSTAGIPIDASSAPTILLAEDNEVNINTFSSYLRAKGYRVIIANNGHETIALYQSQQPDLILMDIQMPDLDGIEAIEYIRQQSTQIQPPIIAITALAMAGDREKCLAAGANKYLTKPLKLKELHQTIQDCLDLN